MAWRLGHNIANSALPIKKLSFLNSLPLRNRHNLNKLISIFDLKIGVNDPKKDREAYILDYSSVME